VGLGWFLRGSWRVSPWVLEGFSVGLGGFIVAVFLLGCLFVVVLCVLFVVLIIVVYILCI
jgi:hypothetical protein